MKTLAEKIAVMQALETSGKEIQFRRRNNPISWEPCPLPNWNWQSYDYRVKPKEPRVVYTVFKGGHIWTALPIPPLGQSYGPEYEVVKFIEVLDNQ